MAELTWDLGGLTYEMAVRDHYRLDVLARRAAELQDADAQLGEVQRLLASAEAGVHGQCRSCGAVHSRGAAYCWQCGAPLLSEGSPEALTAGSNGAGSSNGPAVQRAARPTGPARSAVATTSDRPTTPSASAALSSAAHSQGRACNATRPPLRGGLLRTSAG